MSLKPSLLTFRFKEFEHIKDGDTTSEWLGDCHGNRWMLSLRQNGNTVGLILYYKADREVKAKHAFVLRDSSGKVYHEYSFKPCLFRAKSTIAIGVGKIDMVTRSSILKKENGVLFEGALLVHVHIQYQPAPNSLQKPPSSLATKMLQLLENTDNADVSFMIGGTVVCAHKLVLSLDPSVLTSLCGENDNDGSPIPINDITLKIFRFVLRYVYGEQLPIAADLQKYGKDIIKAADRFGVVGLKLATENALVQSTMLTTKNAADWLIFADSKTCPLLKEHATEFFVSRSEDILNSEHSADLKESPKLLTELMMEIAKSANNSPRVMDETNMSVNDLRKKLNEKGLEIDGSKEMLVSRLQAANKRQREEITLTSDVTSPML